MKDLLFSKSYLSILLWLSFLCTFLIPLFILPLYFMGTDYSVWGNDAEKFSRCINLSIQPCRELSKFPIGYLGNSFLINFFNNYGLRTELAFTFINLVFLFLPIIFLFTIYNSKVAFSSSVIYISCLLLTPIPSFYIYSGGLEVQSGILIGLFLSSFILFIQNKHFNKTPLLLFFYVSAFLFPLYKDIVLITVVLSLLLSVFIYFEFYKNFKVSNLFTSFPIIIVFLLLIFSFCISLYFNYFKYQRLIPLAYLYESSISSPSKFKSFEFFIASLFSPNGGILSFWFASFIVCYFLTQRRNQSFSILTLLTSTFLFLGTILGLSLWWAPFGWDSWGNRLIVPTMLGILITLISTMKAQDTQDIKNVTYSITAKEPTIKILKIIIKVTTVFLFIFSLHYVLVSYYVDKSKLLRESLLNHPSCIEMMTVLKRDGQKQGFAFWRTHFYYSCARDRFLHIPSFWKQF